MLVLRIAVAAEESGSAETLYRSGVNAYAQKDYSGALRLFREMQKEYPRSARAVRGWEYIAQCENALGNPYSAFEAYQQIWDNHKDFKGLPTITRNQMKIGNYFLKRKRYKQAIEVYEAVLRNAPYSDVAAAAHYSMAQAYIARDEYEAAKSELERVIRDHAASQLVDDAAYDLGYVDFLQSRRANYDQTATTEAIASFRRFIHNFPSSPKVPQAQQYVQQLRTRKAASLYRMGEYYQNIKAPKAAAIAYTEVIEQYPDTPYADEARIRVAQVDATGLSKADRAQRERQMAELRSGMEQAQQGEIVQQQTLVVQEPAVAPTTPAPAPRAASRAVPRASQQLSQNARQYSQQRVQRMMQDPETRAELRASMKEAYLEEMKESRAKQRALENTKMTLLSESRNNAAQVLSTRAASTPAAPAASAAWTTPTPSPTPDEPVSELSMSSDTGTQATPVEETMWTPAAPAPTPRAATVTVTAPAQPAPTPAVYTPPETRGGESQLTKEASEVIDEVLQYNQYERDAERGTPEPIPAAPAPAPAPAAPVVTTPPAPTTTGVGTPRVAGLQETPLDNLPPHLQQAVAESRSQAAAAPPAGGEPTVVYQQYTAPEPTATETTPVLLSTQQQQALDEARQREQERAAAARMRAETARPEPSTGAGWTTRPMPADNTVRRARVDEEGLERRGTTFDTDSLQREYSAIYYLIQRGDAAMQQGIYTRAKEHYSDALEKLQEIKQKAPNWESDVVNFRIDYCRKQMRSVQ
jgi:outer membrane protein assembly factor BamD